MSAIIRLVSFFGAALVAGYFLMPGSAAVRTLRKAGYTDIAELGPSGVVCKDGRNVSREFRTERGKRTVCCNDVGSDCEIVTNPAKGAECNQPNQTKTH